MYVQPDLVPDLHLMVTQLYGANVKSSIFMRACALAYLCSLTKYVQYMYPRTLVPAFDQGSTWNKGVQPSSASLMPWETDTPSNCTAAAGMLVARNMICSRSNNQCHQQQQTDKERYSEPYLIYYSLISNYFLSLCFVTLVSVEKIIFFI